MLGLGRWSPRCPDQDRRQYGAICARRPGTRERSERGRGDDYAEGLLADGRESPLLDHPDGGRVQLGPVTATRGGPMVVEGIGKHVDHQCEAAIRTGFSGHQALMAKRDEPVDGSPHGSVVMDDLRRS